ncbi:patatin-like phospholipase family protein [Algibacter sp. L4_22]|uniref:patatin-like phospholipase family protein n=1 Tax=Algibacter sp. L4_22 TaxID=2942477 RepID=UPI00201B4C21|nr:patatin-like phospholipase family protein [Algibacter sp. L4_22]MCL5127727.1 patatin-like phospholipase family protein [Algibacter sp. L4_22]
MKTKAVNKFDKKIGLVLSGGGARAYAHIGVLQALNENGIYPTHLSGSSAGALVGALYCNGYSPLEILELAKSHEFLQIFKIGFVNKELTEMTRLKSFLIQYLKDDFNTLKIPLSICASNLNLGNYEIRSSGKLIEFIAASCAVPLLFKPIKIKGHLYVDGGLLNNLPIEPLLETSNKIIGVSVNEHEFKDNIKGAMQLTQRCLQLAVWNTLQERIEKCDASILIDKHFNYGMFSISKSQELFDIGYKQTIDKMDSILKAIG